jgi:hypothetical protein
MKKIIIAIISAMILMPTMANAQINIGEKKSTMKKVATISMSWYDLYEFNGEYLLSLKSTNQFDDNFWLHLGTKEEAIDSLNSLIELCSSLGKDDVVEISNGMGKTYRVYKYSKGLSFHQKEPGMAGFTYIYKMYLTKTLNVIKK